MIFWDAVTHHQNRHHLPDELPPASAPFTSRPFTSKVSRLMSFLPGRKRRESWLIMVNHGCVRQVVGLDFRKFAWDLNGCLYGIGWDFTINHGGSFSTNTPWRHQTPVSAATEINGKKCEFSSHVSLPLANH